MMELWDGRVATFFLLPSFFVGGLWLVRSLAGLPKRGALGENSRDSRHHLHAPHSTWHTYHLSWIFGKREDMAYRVEKNYFQNIVEQDPSWARNKSYRGAGTKFTQPCSKNFFCVLKDLLS